MKQVNRGGEKNGNPHLPEIPDESSGTMVKSQRHQDWNNGKDWVVQLLMDIDKKAGDAAAFRVMVRGYLFPEDYLGKHYTPHYRR